jgi:hypothetical protein
MRFHAPWRSLLLAPRNSVVDIPVGQGTLLASTKPGKEMFIVLMTQSLGGLANCESWPGSAPEARTRFIFPIAGPDAAAKFRASARESPG